MINKLWYKGHEDEADQYIYRLTCSRNYIQKYIDLYCSHEFTVPEDIIIENLDVFLKAILPHYQNYMFGLNELWCLGESISTYFYRAYYDDFPYSDKILDTDKRSISLEILNSFNTCETIMPEDIPFLLNCLNAPEEEIEYLSKNGIEDYFKQFDRMQRSHVELEQRTKLLKEQRIAAIAKGEPLPIKPMGMKLDPCYKKTS